MLKATSFFDGIFVVNLRRRPDRWKSILHEATVKAGLDESQLERVDAYDGSAFSTEAVRRSGLLSPVGLDRYLNLSEKEKIWGMDLSAGGIGCALSHVDIWLQVYQRKLQRALILEDDTIMPGSGNFSETVQDIFRQAVPSDWEYVFLSGLDPESQCQFLRVKKKQENRQERFVCRVPRIYRTTNCYVLNQKGASSLLEKCVPFTFQLDTAMTTMLVGETKQERADSMKTEFVRDISCYCVDPPLCAQATRFGTDIQWKSEQHQNHNFDREEKSRLKAAGLI